MSDVDAALEAIAEQSEEQSEEVPSVFSVTNRHIAARVDVSPPDEVDGSRILRLYSGNGGTIIEANLSAQVCAFMAQKLTEIEVITQDDEEEEDAGTPADES